MLSNQIIPFKLSDKFDLFDDHWNPRIVAQINDHQVKIAKVKGEFVWHDHAREDELFFVLKGTLYIDLRNGVLELGEGDMAVIPKGTEHRPRTGSDEAWIMLFEPGATRHTGSTEHGLTNNRQEFI